MFRQSFNSIFFLIAITFSLSIGVAAQSTPVTGTVETVTAAGTREPVAGALIEVYRTDIKAGFPSAKTGKRGEFSFAGMPYGGVFVFAVSAPGHAPTVLQNVKAGQEKLLITMVPGDGSKFTEEQVRKGAIPKADAATGELTAEQKKEQAAYEAKLKEVTEKNKNAEKTNEIVARVLKEGNEAFGTKNYDVAIVKYQEGIAADATFVGTAPIFYNNRGTALTARAVDTYNKSIKLTDATEKIAGLGRTKKRFHGCNC